MFGRLLCERHHVTWVCKRGKVTQRAHAHNFARVAILCKIHHGKDVNLPDRGPLAQTTQLLTKHKLNQLHEFLHDLRHRPIHDLPNSALFGALTRGPRRSFNHLRQMRCTGTSAICFWIRETFSPTVAQLVTLHCAGRALEVTTS